MQNLNTEETKKYKKAVRFIYKMGREDQPLTDDAIEACKRQGISIDDLLVKTVKDFEL